MNTGKRLFIITSILYGWVSVIVHSETVVVLIK